MQQVFESSKLLLDIWKDINDECFSSQLRELSFIGWLDLSGEPDLEEPFGAYLGRQNSIAISKRFYCLETRSVALEIKLANERLTKDERNTCLEKIETILEICYRLVAHEATHQAVQQFEGTAGSHGDAFVQQARRIAEAKGIAPPTVANAHCWPEVVHLIAQENANGAFKA